MKLSSKLLIAAGAVTLGTTAPAFAQNATDPAVAEYPAPVEEDDDSGNWGLLGLLGLAGLLGLKRRDRDDNYRATGTGTTNRN